ncbi:hypothetical protein K491DRAFT_760871 [Lophiostoma macrostomum CBS 122681]|uniref:Uncharacterized protein n=1 Tax=Lophiostoma macrostomum CBS 122681 TaxID=1314788 RepID=A0A6A6SVR7_9PLEO|nr:hypothetical protein K491DRAFT_760871 [Lophiostoma macrostomum CBS 122681]
MTDKITTQDQAIELLSSLYQQITDLDLKHRETRSLSTTSLSTEAAEDRLKLLEELTQERGLVQRTIQETLENAEFTRRYSFALGVKVGEKLAKQRQLEAEGLTPYSPDVPEQGDDEARLLAAYTTFMELNDELVGKMAALELNGEPDRSKVEEEFGKEGQLVVQDILESLGTDRLENFLRAVQVGRRYCGEVEKDWRPSENRS